MRDEGLQKELGISIGFHAMMIVAGLFYLPHPAPFIVPEQALPVDFVSIEEFTRLRQKQAAPPQAENQPQNQSQSQDITPPAPPRPSDAMPPLTKDKPPSKAETKPPPKPENETPLFAHSIASPRPVARPQRGKTFLDTDEVQALLDKTPSDRPRFVPTPTPSETEHVTLSEIDAFRAQMKRCWSVPVGAADADALAVRVKLGLNRDGTISSGPYLVNRNRIDDPYFRAAVESVLRAIKRCQPFTMPADKYPSWQQLELNFDPKEMFGG